MYLLLVLMAAYSSSTALMTTRSTHQRVLFPERSRSCRLCVEKYPHREIDDDDVSQHVYMSEQPKKGSYRPIEEWHDEQVEENPKQVLTKLQQEKAKWDKKFENMGGEGI